MTIKTINHSDSIQSVMPNGMGRWRSFDVVAEVGENEDVYEAGLKLIKTVENLHKLSIPQELANHQPEPPSIPQPKQSPEEKKQETISAHIKTINECKTLNNVMIFKNLVSRTNEPELTEAFENKLKTFQ